MRKRVSAAEPEQLMRYSDRATAIDQQLASQSQTLSARLQHFEAACSEYRLHVSHLADSLRDYARLGDDVDTWVRKVGVAFQWAGSAGWWVPLRSWIVRVLPPLNWLFGWPPRVRIRPPRIPPPPWFPVPVPTPRPTPSPVPAAPPAVVRLRDGRVIALEKLRDLYPHSMKPVSDVDGENKAHPVDAEITSTAGLRDARLYDSVINQFGVATNSRYQGPDTYCNVFAWDVTRAMGAEIPRYRDRKGRPLICNYDEDGSLFFDIDGKAVPFAEAYGKLAFENKVSHMRSWLLGEGSTRWRRVSAEQAQQWANQGKPVVVLDKGGTHIGIVRPGELDPAKGPRLAQAGRESFGDGDVLQGFGAVTTDYNTLEYYVAE